MSNSKRSAEAKYTEALEALGIYDPAFAGEIHQLCILERELSRTMKLWKATAPDKDTPPSPTDPLYAIITQQRRDILAHRDALGLTPKALKRLQRREAPAPAAEPQSSSPALSAVLEGLRSRAAASVSTPDTEAAP